LGSISRLIFSSSDMLNSTLVEPSTGALSYTIMTRPHFIKGNKCEIDEPLAKPLSERRTILADSKGRRLAEIGWVGLNQPTYILIGEERLETAKELFGCMGAPMSPKVFGVSTRFDTEYYWLASPESLTLLDYDANKVKGQLHSSSLLVGSHFMPVSPMLPGSDYLEFEQHPLASDEELIVTFLLMEIMRRTRFAIKSPPYSLNSSPISKTWLVRSAGERLRRVGSGLNLRRKTI